MPSGKGTMKQIDDMIDAVLDELMSKAARMKKSRAMKQKSKQIAKKRAISMKRKAPLVKLKKRAQKKAIDYVATKLFLKSSIPVNILLFITL